MITGVVAHANPEVLAFYMQLPFNYRPSIQAELAEIRRIDVSTICRSLRPVLRPQTRVLEIGCGVGWLACHLSESYGCRVTAIDFNPIAIERAVEIAAAMRVSVEFQVGDLWVYEPAHRADVVISNGVLMHTHDCLAAMQRCIERFTTPAGDFIVGLYHRFGRQPFLDHFKQLAEDGASEEQMLAEYRRLHSWLSDATHAYSWFRDQVLHPHETQHTLREVVETSARCGFDLVSTSINRFAPFTACAELYELEPMHQELARRRLRAGTYFPGFFMTHLRGRGESLADA